VSQTSRPAAHARRWSFEEPSLTARIVRARLPVFVLDYDGTLRDFESDPAAAAPDPRLRQLLTLLAERASVYIVSGRPAGLLEAWLGDLGVGLVCEHGLSIKPAGEAWEQRAALAETPEDELEQLLQPFVARTPGSSIEQKSSSLAWHYRASEPHLADHQAKLLLEYLDDALAGSPCTVLRGSRVIEIRPRHVTKARGLRLVLERHPDADLLFCAGDDVTDDEMMASIPEKWSSRAIACAVGAARPSATHFVESCAALRFVLEEIVRLRASSRQAVPRRFLSRIPAMINTKAARRMK
jgi:trehalose 6-phosphate synthase/phosphatase